MGKARFLYDNVITDESMLSVSSLRLGLVTGALKEGTGSAVMATSGLFSGPSDAEYIVEIDSIAGGAEVGQATFRWSDGSGVWIATGVVTSASPITLNHGISIAFTAGSGADFVAGDKWYFKAVNLFGAGKMLNVDRDQRYRSAALESPNTITIDLSGIADPTFDSIILFDHNLTDAGTIHFEADDAATFDSNAGSPQFSEPVTWASEKIVHYFSASQTKNYARLKITDTGNPDGYIEIGGLYLGTYLELSRNYSEGYGQDNEFLMVSNVNPYGVERDRFFNKRQTFTFDFNAMTAADVASIAALVTAICRRSTGEFKRFWFNSDSDVAAELWMVKLVSFPVKNRTSGWFDIPCEMREVVRSV